MKKGRALALLGVVTVAHAVYYAWPAGAQRRWAFYVLGGVAFAAAMLMHLPDKKARATEVGAVGGAACLWGALEGLQQAGCGALGWMHTPKERDLCVELVGPWPYVLAASALLAWLIVIRKQ